MKQTNTIRTDLAMEMARVDGENEGYTLKESRHGGISYTLLHVQSEAGEAKIGKERGHYLTADMGQIWLDDEETVREKTNAFASLLARSCQWTPHDQDGSIFVACLGNPAVTADSLGPAVQNRLHISRHLRQTPIRHLFGRRELSSLSPGVTGQTGIETAALIRHAVSEVRPSLILAIDALAARSPHRLCTTIQLSDTGLAPGSGIGNRRDALNQTTLGAPVIAIGVPTLVDSGTLLSDAFEELGIDEDEKTRSLLDPDRHFFVTRKETDLAVTMLAGVIAEAINRFAQ